MRYEIHFYDEHGLKRVLDERPYTRKRADQLIGDLADVGCTAWHEAVNSDTEQLREIKRKLARSCRP